MAEKLPEYMTVIAVPEPGGPEKLVPETRPLELPETQEVLVQVAGAGLNRPDVMQRQGNYPPPKGASDIPGLEISGTIVALGADVRDWKVGDRVCALVSGGGYAEYCRVPAPQCLPVPAGFTMVEAASLPESFFTVWSNLIDRVHLKKGESLLVHGGSSGIGTAAIQIGRVLGARVFVTAGSAEKCTACEELGAERAINYREEDFVEVAKELTGGKGVDVILDIIGGDYIPRNISLLATEGRMTNIAYQKGPKAEVNFLAVMLKRLTITGSTLRIRSVEFKGEIAAALKEHIWPEIEKGAIRPVVHATFPLEKADDAHRLMESSAHIGKIVLTTAKAGETQS
ncbi:MAG: NAD(P)H-quinone oxidoreductase [Rhodospirillaceae bacterium]|jgi:NADPH:quinone reductase|nr:NAD(P)H-quinone oxidoreductase [Rhodospirillaceae bacterium]MBT5659609.1 NAD(P)H-quinone oxidoreductase [Rhodospirillaceae bacterium]MBT5752105.1 NAD(P)H-quinone oxidoreductase [Rhodospirillaceae bacterium]